ncbi:ileal sodium/bile acid cotransporter-like [Arapaima gigas]
MLETTTFTNNCVSGGICSSNTTLCAGPSCEEQAGNIYNILNLILDTVLPLLLALVVFSMGCITDIKKLWGHIKQPWGILLGFACQFSIMPFTAFILSIALNTLPMEAVTVLIMGCSPGGSFSNVFAYWLDGDMDLRCRTIALKTGIQNTFLCSTIMNLSFTIVELQLIFRFPIIYFIFVLLLSLSTVAGYQVYKHFGHRCVFEAVATEQE